MYAYDTIIYFNLKDFDPATIERDINSGLEKINVWLKLNKLSPNVKKTKYEIKDYRLTVRKYIGNKKN